MTIFPVARWLLCLLCTQCAKPPPQVSGRLYPDIQYGRKFWQEDILAGRYFGGLLKLCHLAEFTLAVEKVLAIMIFIAKWLIERAGNLTGP